MLALLAKSMQTADQLGGAAQLYTTEEAKLSFELCLATTCATEQYMDQGYLFEGTPAEGFVTTKVLYWADYDVPGYIGYLPSNETIYVVMRATFTELNRKLNVKLKKVKYTKWPECDGCKVHEGWFSAVEALNGEATAEVKRL